jgi:hypothetical protein
MFILFNFYLYKSFSLYLFVSYKEQKWRRNQSLLENYQIQTEIPMEKIQLVNYSDIYRRNIMSLFLYVFTGKNTYIGEYQGNHK